MTVRFRWVICTLLFAATAANYADRGLFGNLAPEMQSGIGWSPAQYWYMQGAFFAAYAFSYLVAGRLIDGVGLKLGYAVAMLLWSLGLMSHAVMSTVAGFFVARVLLGLGEGGNFPAAVKTTAEWFPKRERGTASGFFNAGCNVGALVVPIVLPWIVPSIGWKGCFLVIGVVNVIWVGLWLKVYGPPETHPKVTKEELAEIRSDPPEPAAPLGWGALVTRKQSLVLALAKFLTDCMSWFYLAGSPVFLADRFGLNLMGRGLPLASIYGFACLGAIFGGALSGQLIDRGWGLGQARKATLLVCALAVLPVAYAAYTGSYWTAVFLIGFAYSAHQAWAATMWIMIADLFPSTACASVAGFTGMAGSIGGILLFVMFGHIHGESALGDYRFIFWTASVAYPIALLIVHVCLPNRTYGSGDDEAANAGPQPAGSA